MEIFARSCLTPIVCNHESTVGIEAPRLVVTNGVLGSVVEDEIA
jgi:hypothetical protein